MRSAGCLSVGFLAAASVVYAERLPIQVFTAADGLAHDRVKCIVRDSRGLLWFCSAAGIDWFDGRRFAGHTLDDKLAISTNDVLEGPDHIYWIATNGRGVTRLDPAAEHIAAWPPARANGAAPPRLRSYKVGDGAATNRVNKLFRDRSGVLWAGTDDGLFRLESGGFHSVALPIATSHHVQIWSFAETADAVLWIGTTEGLFRRMPDDLIAREPLRSAGERENIWSLLAADDGTLWIGDQNGVSRASVNGSGFHAAPVSILPFPRAAFALHKTANGVIWIGYRNGPLVRYDGREFRQFTREQGLPQGGVVMIATDGEENVWIATGIGGGAMRILRNGFQTYGQDEGVQGEVIDSLFETRAGEVCALASATGLLQCFDGRRFVGVRPQLPRGAGGWHRWRRTLQSRDGTWWFGTSEGLYRFAPVNAAAELARIRPSAVYTTAQGLPANQVSGMFEDSHGDLWIWSESSDGYAMSRWLHATGAIVRVHAVPSSKQAWDVSEDDRGGIWMGFRDGGLGRWRNGEFQMFGRDAGVPDDAWIGSVYRDRRGRLWISGGADGLFKTDEPWLDQPRFVRYTTAQGPAPYASCFAEDRWGNLYVGTGFGIDRLDLDRNWTTHYDAADGLVDVQAWTALTDRSGTLWFGTSKGIARLTPERLDPPQAPEVRIHTFRIGGTKYPLSVLGETDVPRVAVPLGYSPIDIEYASAAANAQYQYRLEGADRDWQRPTVNGTVTFANLRAGSYRFAVRAVRRGGVAGRPATVAFTIVPPFWQRPWFLGVVAVALMAIAYAVHRSRLTRLLAVERIRTRIATDLHDDIGSSLSRIAILSEVASRRLGPAATDVGDTLGSIGRTAGELVESMSDIVWAINPRHDALQDLSGRMRRFASDLLTARDIAFRFEAPDRDGEVHLSPELRRDVYLTFKEGLHNIVRHARCTEVAAQLRMSDGSLELTLSDNGSGFDGRQSAAGHGLASLRARADALQGALSIQSAPGHGTSLQLRLPLRTRRKRFPHLLRW